MAGGKETPRQKMIGMMYLVLTALLALNVSKSILDAFVAIEENTQKSAVVQLDRGNSSVSDLKRGITENEKEAPAKAGKCRYFIGVSEKIDKRTADIIQYIDEIKINILEKSGETLGKDLSNAEAVSGEDADIKIDWSKIEEKINNKDVIVWKKYDKKQPLRPSRLNLMAVQAKDQYDVPMHEIIGEEINNPDTKKSGMKLWKMYNDYRAFIVETVGSVHDKFDSLGRPVGNPQHNVKTTAINTFKDNMDLDKQVMAMLNKTNVFVKDNGNVKKHEDIGLLKQLYMELTKQERYEEVNDVKNVHWIGKTFDHSPLVAALASLTSMQLEILNARATAIGTLASKVVVAELSFNKLIALASISPSVANPGDPVELRVVMGAYDTDNMPDMGEGGWTIENGMAIKKMSAPSGDQTYSGTISIKSRSGAVKSESWETKIGVLTNEKEASIVCKDLMVVYAGIPMDFKASATGMYKNVRAVPERVVATQAQIGQTISVRATGTDSKGSTVTFAAQNYLVKPTPKAELFWNGQSDGGRPNKSAGSLTCAFGNTVPFDKSKGNFTVVSYVLSVSGLKGAVQGSGSQISAAHLTLIRNAGAGKCTISVQYNGTASGKATAMFDI
jgi:hypothetical protein